MKIISLPAAQPVLTLFDFEPPLDRFCVEVAQGLSAAPKQLPPKYFYDRRGARLFEEITRLPAYYLTRTEIEILRSFAGEIAAVLGPDVELVEFGSGSGEKTRIVLEHLRDPVAYLPIDISRAQLIDFALDVARSMPSLLVRPVCADYTSDLVLPEVAPGARRIGFFPGSTLGNFEPERAEHFLARVRTLLGPGGALLLGIDLRKDVSILERAYNDPEGITAAFNLNLLERINRECGADLDLESFRHHAGFDPEASRIEMHLISTRRQVAHLPDPEGAGGAVRELLFEEGEAITTEYSYKYDPDSLQRVVQAGGWQIAHLWTDPRAWFAVVLLEAG